MSSVGDKSVVDSSIDHIIPCNEIDQIDRSSVVFTRWVIIAVVRIKRLELRTDI